MLTINSNFVVIDCETTGLGKHDRVLEVAAITIDSATLEVIDEYDTLINPQRDVGPVNIHGITASMVELAPSFEEVAGSLAQRMSGNVLVAHNLSFDVRMLRNEYDRLNVPLDDGLGVCTLAATREKLHLACARYGISISHQHRALADARATAELLRHCLDQEIAVAPATVQSESLKLNPRTLRRDAADLTGRSVLNRILSRAAYPSSDAHHIQYLDMLDFVLDDLELEDDEEHLLNEVAGHLGIPSQVIRNLHMNYFISLRGAAERDGVITDAEHHLLSRIAHALGIDEAEVPAASIPSGAQSALDAGTRVCFTGTVTRNGNRIERSSLEALAASAGMQPVSSVTQKGCDALVTADTSSMSGKTKKARDLGLPIIAAEAFLEQFGL
jgi:DNA polymerase-3 subunit epsilon